MSDEETLYVYEIANAKEVSVSELHGVVDEVGRALSA